MYRDSVSPSLPLPLPSPPSLSGLKGLRYPSLGPAAPPQLSLGLSLQQLTQTTQFPSEIILLSLTPLNSIFTPIFFSFVS